VFPDLDECQRLEPVASAQERFASLLQRFAAASTGSSNRIELAVILNEAPSLDLGEITDKGSINQREVLRQKADLVEALYSGKPAPAVIARFGRLVSAVEGA
jgi:feruloyl-CoA synthase